MIATARKPEVIKGKGEGVGSHDRAYLLMCRDRTTYRTTWLFGGL